jgi:hypothetical protein
MATEVNVTDEFKAWYLGLTQSERNSIIRIVGLLEEKGTLLGFPYSSAIQGSSIALRELRVQHMGDPFRILYAFDPRRNAVLLVGGNKAGKGSRWYESAIAVAERVFAEYITETGGE